MDSIGILTTERFPDLSKKRGLAPPSMPYMKLQAYAAATFFLPINLPTSGQKSNTKARVVIAATK